MKSCHLTFTLRKWKRKLTSRRRMEKQLSDMLTQINKSEDEMLDRWRQMEVLRVSRERKYESLAKAAEKNDLALQNRRLLMEKVGHVESELNQALERRQKATKESINVQLRVEKLKKQLEVVEKNCEFFWDMTFCINDDEERNWRENLRPTRSQSAMNKVVLRPPLAEDDEE